jgi:hypothetical protein
MCNRIVKGKSTITLEMLGLKPATEKLTHLNEIKWFEYKGYFGRQAICALDIYADDKNFVIIVTELPDNPGTSITNRAEVVAETLETAFEIPGHAFSEALFNEPMSMRYTYIEHYPRSKYRGDWDENFSIVTFKDSRLRTSAPKDNPQWYSQPNWVPLEREEIERFIGQPFAPERNYDVKR